MATAEKKKLYSPAEYLKLERAAEHKSEFYNGEIFAMSGASRDHNVITINFVSHLSNKLKGTNCRPFSNDMRIHIPANSLYTYPDVLVVCGKEEFLDGEFDTLMNPVFLAEVLSPSTVDYDSGRKFMFYRSIPSLKEYWTISSYEYRLQKFLKNEKDQSWVLSETTGKAGQVQISTLNIMVPLKELYDGVEIK